MDHINVNEDNFELLSIKMIINVKEMRSKCGNINAVFNINYRYDAIRY